MQSGFKNIVRSGFAIICFICVIIMISFWIYKFKIEDRSIGVVDYETLEGAETELPVLSLCFMNPFKPQSLKNVNPSMNPELYLQYLKGQVDGNQFTELDYESVSLNLQDYFEFGYVKLSNDSSASDPTMLHFKHREIFSGIYLKNFVKCFSPQIKKKDYPNLQALLFSYNYQKILQDLEVTSTDPIFNIHYPGQYLLIPNPSRAAPLTRNRYNGANIQLMIKNLEILNRRNTNKQKCLDDWKNYDSLVLRKHVENQGCQMPYQNEGFPKCKRMKEMEDAAYDLYDVRKRYYPKACQRISKIDFDYSPLNMSGKLQFLIVYPEDVKMITQTKELDEHALIGNIGGYIGLFLGKLFYKHDCVTVL